MLRVRQVKIEVTQNTEENRKKALAKKLKITSEDIQEYQIIHESLDARNKENIYFVYEFYVSVKNEEKILKKGENPDIRKAEIKKYVAPKKGTTYLLERPIIIGSGPAGLFSAYLLAEQNFKPLIIERGEEMEKRIKTVEEFWHSGKLNPNSNVQFGEGGAGTFSDGKLNTLVKDSIRHSKIFEIFVECGAPKEIIYSYKPHIGTDLLASIIINMRKKIIEMGGTFLYSTCLTDIKVENEKITAIEINHQKEIPCSVLILAIGHSARDTFQMLYEKKIDMLPKPFAIGLRIQHFQEMMNVSQYGEKYKTFLDAASYKVTYKASNNRGVYSFCMCPGGYVVNASSENGRLAINGMSYHKRDTENANSAIVVTVTPTDFGSHPLDGIAFQRKLEEITYQLGNGNIPIQLLKDFEENKVSTKFGLIKPLIKGNYQFANLNELFNEEICKALKEAFPYFETKIKGFNRPDAILAGIESRTSSPVRILRNERLESNYHGIYPCGEGAGYAGGITSAAIDGIKVAEEVIKKYNNHRL